MNTPKGTAYGAFEADASSPSSSFPWPARPARPTSQPTQPRSPTRGSSASARTNPTHQYVVAVVVDQGGYGANAAAPVVASVFNYLLANPVGPAGRHAPRPPHPAVHQPAPDHHPGAATTAAASHRGPDQAATTRHRRRLSRGGPGRP